jgi:cysteine desulfurase
LQAIYLDHNATTPLDPEVLEAMLPVLRDQFGNPSSIHSQGRVARVRIDEAREQVAALINAHPSEIIFTSGGTESDNLAVQGVALALQKNGRHIITSQIEHPAVLNPCRELANLGFKTDFLPVDRWGRVCLEQLPGLIDDKTILISIQQGNSEVGTLQDIGKIGAIANGVLFHTDAVQCVGKVVVDVKALPVDLLSFSAHKLNGPKGVGALYVRKGSPKLYPLISGGGQEKKRRAGTENVAGIVGFGKACELAKRKLASECSGHLELLRGRLYELIKAVIPGVEVYGHPDYRLPNTLNLGFKGVDGDTLLMGLDVEGISVSTGSACSSGSLLPSHVLTAMGIPEEEINSTLRFSIGWSNTADEMEKVSRTLAQIVQRVRGLASTA